MIENITNEFEKSLNEKTKYDLLCELLMNELGCEYNITYFLNTRFKWNDIINPDEIIQGAIVTQGGDTFKDGDGFGSFENLVINFAIPTNDDFNSIVEYITEKLINLNGYQFVSEDGSKQYSLTYSNKTSASLDTISGVEYGLISFSCGIMEYKSILLSKNRSVHIMLEGKKTLFEGVLSAVWSSTKNCDGEVYGLRSSVQRNDIAGVQLQLEIDAVLVKDNALHQSLCNDSEKEIKYTIDYDDGLCVKHVVMILAQVAISTPLGDKAQAKFTFITAGGA